MFDRPRNFVVPREDYLLAASGTPAFVRRALAVQAEESHLAQEVARRRFEALQSVSTATKRLVAVAGGLDPAARFFADPGAFRDVHRDVQADPRWPDLWVDASAHARATARALAERVDRFNRRWPTLLAEVDLGPLNDAIDRYNRYYPIEREAFARYTVASQWNVESLPPRTHADFEREFGLLPRLEAISE